MAEHNQGALVAAEAAEILARIIRARRRREELLSAELFADPAWDIPAGSLVLRAKRDRSVR